MKRLLTILITIVLTTNVYSQNSLISFEGSGETTIVDNVIVKNLTQGTSLIVKGSDQLRLIKKVTGLKPVRDNKDDILCIYPNPAKEYCTVEFEAPQAGFITTEVYDILGKKVLQESKYFEKGTHLFQISGLGRGFYNLNVKSIGFHYTGKIVSQSNTRGLAQINYIGQTDKPVNVPPLKSKNTEVQMQYNSGDRLKLTGISGIYSTVVIDIPTESKSISFNFIACTDVDGNNYPIVIIGAQTWMAENLNYETGNSWCYNNIGDNCIMYGRLYDWQTASNACPSGWHLPNDGEWQSLEGYLGMSSSEVDGTSWRGTDEGTKLKSTNGWDQNGNGTDAVGFTALPGGYRIPTGNFTSVSSYGSWWASTEGSSTNAWYRDLEYNHPGVLRLNGDKNYGASVRCVRD